MFQSSMSFTIGSALALAQEHAYLVEILMEGHWVSGVVLATDTYGVVLETESHEHLIIRPERVTAVLVKGAPAANGTPNASARAHPAGEERPRTAAAAEKAIDRAS